MAAMAKMIKNLLSSLMGEKILAGAPSEVAMVVITEARIKYKIKKGKQYIKEEGFKLVSVVDGISSVEYLERLMIYKKYAMKSENDNVNYLDLLDAEDFNVVINSLFLVPPSELHI